MRVAVDLIASSCPEADIYSRLLALDNKHILDVGLWQCDDYPRYRERELE